MHLPTLGRYRVVKELGRGAMGQVFLAHDPSIDRPVAVKTVQVIATLPESERSEAHARFLREARAAGRLRHPAIVTVFDVGEHDGVPFLAMEYVDGEPLDRFCRPESLLPPPVACAIVARAADGLAHAHEAGVVHRDIKPANLVRVGESGVKIMDFGLASDPSVQLTQDGARVGTPSYMSPEQIRGETLDGRSDQFSLGCVLYELLTGAKAFGGDTLSSVVYRIVHEPAGGHGSDDARIPPALAGVVRRALAKSPGERYPDAAAFAAALREAAGSSDLPAEASPPTLAPAPPRAAPPPPPSARARHERRTGTPLVLAIAAGILGVSAVGWWWTTRMREGGRAGDTIAAGPALEAFVRTDPPGLAVTLDGRPFAADRVSIPRTAPFGVLEARHGCRVARHELSLADGGGEIVLVPDVAEVEILVDPGVPGATVAVNDRPAVAAPTTVALDLCADNRIRIEAPRFRGVTVELPSGSSPIEARSQASAVQLEAIPLGTLELPRTDLPVTFSIDGRRIDGRTRSIDLEEGEHVLRAESARHFLAVEAKAIVVAGQTVKPIESLPRLARVAVQSFPPDATVSLRPRGGSWRDVGTTPLDLEVAAGEYRVRVVSEGGRDREQAVKLRAGSNPPIRVSLGGGS